MSKRFVLFIGCALMAMSPSTVMAEPTTRSQALGEPQGEYPSYVERVMLYLTNRARSEPDKFNPKEPYPATPPVRWDLKLSEAARFHAEHIIEASCWCEDHSSCCTLQATNGGAKCSDGPQGCGITDATTRVTMFSPAYSAENMALGQRTPGEAVDGWINSSGHWKNMNGNHSLLGVGQYEGAWVQDFGRGGALPPVAEDGIHFSNGTSHTFGISYYQPNSGGPQSIMVIVDGQCNDLGLHSGKPEHGAFEKNMTLNPGCHRYYFYVRDGQGNDHVYPSTGSFGVGVGGEDCPFFSENRPADTCSPAGQTCQTGDTRPCYTGPFGTKNVGKCLAGTERCIAAQWTGECRYEELPDAQETCGNEIDDDCDGVVDNGCAGPEEDMSMTVDMSSDMPASDMSPTDPPSNDDPGGCASTPGRPSLPLPSFLLIVVAGCLFWRRAKRST